MIMTVPLFRLSSEVFAALLMKILRYYVFLFVIDVSKELVACIFRVVRK
jgi:hypothetical protein